jgi:hypothetical protein
LWQEEEKEVLSAAEWVKRSRVKEEARREEERLLAEKRRLEQEEEERNLEAAGKVRIFAAHQVT